MWHRFKQFLAKKLKDAELSLEQRQQITRTLLNPPDILVDSPKKAPPPLSPPVLTNWDVYKDGTSFGSYSLENVSALEENIHSFPHEQTVCTNHPLPLQRFLIFEVCLNSSHEWTVGLGSKPPPRDSLGTSGNSLGFTSEGNLFAGSTRELLRTQAPPQGDTVVCFLIDREPDNLEGVSETAPGWGAVYLFVNNQLITQAPVSLAWLRLPAPFEPKGVHKVRTSSGRLEICARRSDWGGVPAIFPVVSVSGQARVEINFGQQSFALCEADHTTRNLIERLIGRIEFSDLLSRGRFGSEDLSKVKLHSYRITRSVKEEPAKPVEEVKSLDEEQEAVDRCRFVHNLRPCKCREFRGGSDRCGSCGHGKLWHDALPHEGLAKLDERWAVLEGRTSSWREVNIAGEKLFYNVKTRELREAPPVELHFREPAPVLEEAEQPEEKTTSEASRSSRRRRKRSSGSVSVYSASKTPASVDGQAISVHRVFVPSVSSKSRTSNYSVKKDVSVHSKKQLLTRNALAKEVIPPAIKPPSNVRETLTRKRHMGHNFALIMDDQYSKQTSERQSDRKLTGTSVSTMRGAFSDFVLSRKPSGTLQDE